MKKVKIDKRIKNKGFIAISSVLIILSVITALSLSVSILAIGEGQGSLAQTKGRENLSFIDTCVNDALLKLWDSGTYTGGDITYPNGTCNISVNESGGVYTIVVTSNNTAYKKTVTVTATRTSNIQINSYIEN